MQVFFAGILRERSSHLHGLAEILPLICGFQRYWSSTAPFCRAVGATAVEDIGGGVLGPDAPPPAPASSTAVAPTARQKGAVELLVKNVLLSNKKYVLH